MVNKYTLIDRLPAYRDEWVIVKHTQDTDDIIRDIVQAHKEFAGYYDEIGMYFYDTSLEKICDDLYDFCKKNIRYKEESEDDQTTALPAGILTRGHGDCKHYALFIGGCLDAIRRATGEKIDWHYCFASYELDKPTPYHVFVEVETTQGPLWVDPTPGANGRQPVWVVNQSVKTKSASAPALSGIGRVRSIGATALTAAAVTKTGATDAQKTQMVGTALETIGATVTSTGIGAVAGGIIVAVGALVNVAAGLFGNKWSDSSYIRWLIQLYQYYVLGQANVTSDNQVNQADLQAAYNWFTAVTGVPFYDRNTFDWLTGNNGPGGKNNGMSQSDRANKYLSQVEIKPLGVTYDQAYAAAQLAEQMSFFTDAAETTRMPPGGWANLPTAQYWIDQAAVKNPDGTPVLDASGNAVLPSAPATGFLSNLFSGSNWVWIAAGVLALLYLDDDL